MMKKILLAAMLATAISGAAFAEFRAGQTDDQIAAEVSARVAAGETVAQITQAAQTAGVTNLFAVQSALVVATGQSATAISGAMIVAGANPANLLPPTAAGGGLAGGGLTAGGESSGGQTGGGTTGGGATGGGVTGGGTTGGGLTGGVFTGSSNTGGSRAATLGGGGSSGVSPS